MGTGLDLAQLMEMKRMQMQDDKEFELDKVREEHRHEEAMHGVYSNQECGNPGYSPGGYGNCCSHSVHSGSMRY